VWTPRRDPEQEREDVDALTNPAEMPVPVEEEPATVAADGRYRRRVVAAA